MGRRVGHTVIALVVCAIAACLGSATAVAAGYQYAGKWGTGGTGNGQFDGIGGIAIDRAGTVYVSDVGNMRIEKFSAGGAFLATWGTPGSIDGVAADHSGNVYAADYWNHRILKYSASGSLLAQFDTTIAGDFESEPHGVAVDSAGNLWVADSGDSLVKKFSSGGGYLGSLDKGSGTGQVERPVGVAVGPSDSVYVVDYLHCTVKKFTSSLQYVSGHTTICAGDANLLHPVHVAVDGSGATYVADTFVGTLFDDGSVKKLNTNYVLQTRIGAYAAGAPLDGTFCDLRGVAVSPSGAVYLADSAVDRVTEFTPSAVTQPTTTTLTGPAGVKVRTTLKLSGTVSPSGAPGSVKITKTRRAGAKWKSAGSATVAVVSGSFAYSFKPKVKGTWRFVAKYAGGGGYASSASQAKRVKVK